MTELDLQTQVADYLRLQYPGVLFHSDYGSGIRLTPGQAVKMTVQEAKAIIKKTKSPMLKRDLLKFIKRQERKCQRHTK